MILSKKIVYLSKEQQPASVCNGGIVVPVMWEINF